METAPSLFSVDVMDCLHGERSTHAGAPVCTMRNLAHARAHTQTYTRTHFSTLPSHSVWEGSASIMSVRRAGCSSRCRCCLQCARGSNSFLQSFYLICLGVAELGGVVHLQIYYLVYLLMALDIFTHRTKEVCFRKQKCGRGLFKLFLRTF